MNSFYKNIIGLALIISSLVGSAQAEQIMAVLTDNLRPVSTNYIVYPESSNLIAQDIANRINTNAIVRALPVCNSINNAKKQDINKEVIQFTKEFQATYNLNYDILRKISNKLGSRYILLISSSVDIETNFLKETFWNKIPIAGENTINPGYKICTQITLIDPINELILLEKNYDKCISSKDFDLVMPTFSPSSAQLDKFKDYSIYIAKNATPLIEHTIEPEIVPIKKTFIENVKYNITNKIAPAELDTHIKSLPKEEASLDLKQDPNLKLQNGIHDNL